MTTSDKKPAEAFVWVWLPGKTTPVVAGRLFASGNQFLFNYGQTYLARNNAIALYDPELPLRRGVLPLTPGLMMPNCIRDAAPDAWGRRVIINRKFGKSSKEVDAAEIDELTYLLESGSDRIGALDFQSSAEKYVPREASAASLEELQAATALVEKGLPLTQDLDRALLHGSSIGGARPKTMITSDSKKYITKFSSQNDLYNVVKAEFVAMRLAAKAGLAAASVALERAAGKEVLLIERFDRQKVDDGWQRRVMVSALTLLGLDEMMARYASYEDLATIIRHRFTSPKETLKELYGRMVFNILCGNTDDHARNHAGFWNGKDLALTPAYDICPQVRTVGETTQAMLIVGEQRTSQISVCLKAAPLFLLDTNEATDLIARQIRAIKTFWNDVCDAASLTEVDRNFLWGRQFLNPFAFVDAPEILAKLVK
ncbi:phosphatidylinositol kinase [Bradyrhizobium ottawaense]|uniref:type II toxin-antitoxin system HipA family toxin n=1 Tax=Bradyrhizobium TaxID=374 RepID=UPI000BE7BC29|nr:MULTISPECIES: HipA domain-containing protein [Bradyrhizobium]MDA9391731.1 phosphatidylinositol kinase [Bradyrhizobium sp. CCBAU 45394]MDA9489574.1 phosphatidylinositol kinase [Bradyrhizobium sp. CCBAU 11361]MDA9537142.1 phosphatidylinositol kinase [Bradyrhizobium sp. CCBAU 21362]PDT64159.1 phosphatidylinositol kinase [Bradyrhizobium ottawaense]